MDYMSTYLFKSETRNESSLCRNPLNSPSIMLSVGDVKLSFPSHRIAKLDTRQTSRQRLLLTHEATYATDPKALWFLPLFSSIMCFGKVVS